MNEINGKKRKLITPVKCHITVVAKNDGSIPLRNHTTMLGAIYMLFAKTNAPFSYAHHKSSNVKPWSFSLLKFYETPDPAIRKGFSKIEKGMRGYFFLKTIDFEAYNILMKFSVEGKEFKVGDVLFDIESIEVEKGNVDYLPEDFEKIRIRLDSPTFFYNASENELKPFTIENFLRYQCRKFRALGIINLEPERLFPYAWIKAQDTHVSWGHITPPNHNISYNSDKKISALMDHDDEEEVNYNAEEKKWVISFRGIVGEVSFMVLGKPAIKKILGKIFYLSEFTGIGTRTSMGFGHNTFLSIN